MKRALIATLFGALLTLCPTTASAQAGVTSPAGVQAFNDELAYIYAKLLPALKTQADAEARAQLLALGHRTGSLEVTVRQVRGVHLGIDAPPGLLALSTQAVEMRVPTSGTWTLELEADVRVRVKVLWWWVTVDIPPIKLIVDRLSVSASAAFDTTQPDRPTLSQINQPNVDFRVRLRSRNFLFDVLLRLLSPVGNWLAHKLANDALANLQPQLAAFSGQLPGPIPGDGTPLLTYTGPGAVPLGEISRNVDRKIRRDHVPYGTLLMAKMDVPAFDSWEDAYRNGGTGNPGTAEIEGDGGDSAIFTGMYLASQAFRYAKTGDSEALDNVGWMLQGVGNLLDVNGNGLLARVTAPEQSVMGQRIIQHGAYGRATIRGQTWVGLQGGGGISRDQYIGVWFGLILTHDLVQIPAVQAQCATRIQLMLDYMIANDWYIDEDRPAFSGTVGGGFPTFYLGIAIQKLHYLLMGTRLDAAKYGPELQRWAPLSGTAWIGAWTGVMNVDSYYKFNLSHLSYYNYFRLETDPARYQDVLRAFHIVRRYVAHHKNPHFNLIHAAIDPSLAPTYLPAAQEALKQFATRNHRRVSPPVVNTSGVTYVTITLPTLTLPGQNPQPQTRTIPSEPLEIPIRNHTGDFMWQRGPFGTPATPNGGNPLVEKNGLDLVLPYWMGHYHNAW